MEKAPVVCFNHECVLCWRRQERMVDNFAGRPAAVKEMSRVVYDVTSKPPETIERE
jgi:GMP synthase PP-ATPase subunit